MLHCDEDYLSSIGGIEHNLVLNHLGGFPRMASQTRWVNTNSWENSFIFILPQCMVWVNGNFSKLFIGWYTPDKKDQHLPISEGWRALKLPADADSCSWKCWILMPKPLNPIEAQLQYLLRPYLQKTNLKCKASNFPETFEMVTPCSTTFPIYSAIVGGNSPPLLWNIHPPPFTGGQKY